MEIKDIKKRFIEIFGGSENDLRVFASPGRVNLIGEHTDYNGGFVFPAAITMRTVIVLRERNDNTIRLAATDLDIIVEADINKLEDYKTLEWGNYQLGVASELRKLEYNIHGVDMLFDDTVPHGGGLSSSAAIEVATALAFATLSKEHKNDNTPVDMVEMAKVGQLAENNYCGVNCGIMDQFASAMGKKDQVIFLNCKTLDYKLVPLGMAGYKLVISNTNKKRSLATSKYNERRSECESGVEILKKSLPNAECLGDISFDEFNMYKNEIKNETIRKRVEHVIAEDDRVLRSIQVLNNGNVLGFGKLMNQSHDSLRDLYEVTGIELDTLVDEARKIDGTIGSRMTGAGFGGCTVSLVKESSVDEFIEKVGKNYQEKVGLTASFYVCEIGDGGAEIK